jgi:hypothetical protein
MNDRDSILSVDDSNLGQLLRAQRAALILTTSACGYCADYTAQVAALQARGTLDGVLVGKIVLDRPGVQRFKRDNFWLGRLAALPYTVLYRHGRQVDGFGASGGAYLLERVAEAMSDGEQAA